MAGTAITYGGQNFWSGTNSVGPCPFWGDSQEMIYAGNRWGQATNISLVGQITGKCSGDFADLINKQNRLISGFGTDFQTLQISQDGQSIYSQNYAIINSISFDQSRYVNLVNYTVNLTLYQPELFSGVYGVLNPSESWEFQEEDDGTMTVTHQISAKGFNTNTVALENAKGWVLARTGWNQQITPAFIQKCYSGAWNLCPQNIEESWNRLSAEYSVRETYVSDLYNSGVGILRYSTDISSGIQDGVTTVNVNGSLDYCKNGSISGMRSRYKDLNLYAVAVNAYQSATNLVNLNPYYLSSGVDEDQTNYLLNFNVSFDNNPQPLIAVDYTVGVNLNLDTEITDVSMNARIFGRGDLKTRYERVSGYYATGFFPYTLANAEYQAAGGTYKLNPIPNVQSVTNSIYQGEITYSAQWNNQSGIPSGLKNFDYSVSIIPPIRKYSESPSLNCNGTWFVYDLGYINRESISINGSAVVDKNTSIQSGVRIVSGQIQAIRNKYASGSWDTNRLIIDNNQLATGDPANKYITFSVAFSRKAGELQL